MKGDGIMINFKDELIDNPVIAAIRNEKDFENVLDSDIKIVFVLYGNIISIKDVCHRLKRKNKLTFVNVDMINGLRGDKYGIQYIKEVVNPNGIISTNGNVLKHARNLGVFTIQRLFIIDSISIETGLSIARTIKPNAIEILPGIAYKAIELIKSMTTLPIITGGLIYTQKDAVQALSSGAIGVSTSSKELWE
jgi:glycerol uptake operon antiterminator